MSRPDQIDIDDSLAHTADDATFVRDWNHYRLRWLTAHNWLHKLAHQGGDPREAFNAYLSDLKTADPRQKI